MDLLKEIENWGEKYDISFQFWGKDDNNVYIQRGWVDLYNSGSHETPEEAIKDALKWIYRVNRVPNVKRLVHEN